MKIAFHGISGSKATVNSHSRLINKDLVLVRFDQADLIISRMPHDSYMLSAYPDKIISPRNFLIKYPSPNELNEDGLINLINQILSQDHNTAKLGRKILFNLNYAKYGDIINIISCITSEERHSIPYLVRTIKQAISFSDYHSTSSLSLPILTYFINESIINDEIFQLFANQVFERAKPNSNLGIKIYDKNSL